MLIGFDVVRDAVVISVVYVSLLTRIYKSCIVSRLMLSAISCI